MISWREEQYHARLTRRQACHRLCTHSLTAGGVEGGAAPALGFIPMIHIIMQHPLEIKVRRWLIVCGKGAP